MTPEQYTRCGIWGVVGCGCILCIPPESLILVANIGLLFSVGCFI